jgi:acyl carrier protein
MGKIKKEEFIQDIKEILEIEDDVKIVIDTNLADLEEYDSLSVLVIVTMIDKKYGKQISSSVFNKDITIKSLMKLIGKEYFE